jgi:hypothetical protein
VIPDGLLAKTDDYPGMCSCTREEKPETAMSKARGHQVSPMAKIGRPPWKDTAYVSHKAELSSAGRLHQTTQDK